MTDPKPAKPAQLPADTARASDAAKLVYIRNHGQAPLVVKATPVNVMLAAERVTALPANVWAKFKETAFGRAFLDDGTLEETDEEDLTAQPKTAAETADEEDRQAEAELRKNRAKK